MNKIIIIISIFISLLKADEEISKLVIDLTTSDVKKFEQVILRGIVLSKAHYESKFTELDVVVVIHGKSYKFFIKNKESSRYKNDKKLLKLSKEFGLRLKSLSKIYGVKFLMCRAGMQYRKMKKEDLYDFVSLTPNVMIALIDAQNDGYAYMPVR